MNTEQAYPPGGAAVSEERWDDGWIDGELNDTPVPISLSLSLSLSIYLSRSLLHSLKL